MALLLKLSSVGRAWMPEKPGPEQVKDSQQICQHVTRSVLDLLHLVPEQQRAFLCGKEDIELVVSIAGQPVLVHAHDRAKTLPFQKRQDLGRVQITPSPSLATSFSTR